MPAIAHVAISLLFLAILIKISKNEMNYRHALIFAVNSWFGPDIFGWLPYYGEGSQIYMFIHGLGWPIVALLISLPWFYVNNAQMTWKPFKVEKRPKNDKYWLPYIQVLCLVAAGGLFHQFVDIIGHPPYVDHPEAGVNTPWGVVWLFAPDTYFSSQWILDTGFFPCGNWFEFDAFYIFFGIAAPLMFITAFFVMPRKEGKHLLTYAISFYAIYTIILASSYLFVNGPWELTGGESDFGILLYFLIFFFIPLTLIYYGYHGFKKEPIAENMNSDSVKTE